MGSAKVSIVKPQLPMDDKKSIKSILKKPFQALFQKEKKKEKAKELEKETQKPVDDVQKNNTPVKITPVANLLEGLKKLDINEEDDDLKNFSFKVVEEERRSERVDSQSSEDSGFSERTDDRLDKNDDKDDLVDTLKDLTIDKQKKKIDKEKKLQTVVVSRGPVKNKTGDFRPAVHPYCTESGQIYKQINRNTFSGGHLIANTQPDNFPEVDQALTQLKQNNVQNFSASRQDQDDYWHVIQELITEDSIQKFNKVRSSDDILSDFTEVQNVPDNFQTVGSFPPIETEPNPIEEFNTNQTFDDYNLEMGIGFEEVPNIGGKSFIFPTPPHSDHMASPMSDQSNFYPSSSVYTPPSPERSSPIDNSDYEKYQDIAQFDESPPCIIDNVEEGVDKPKARERNLSTSSMTMKQYKDMQKEISTSFAKKDCCQLNRKTCKEIFEEHMMKLNMEDRRALCLKAAKLDLKQASGVLHHIMLSLSESNTAEDLQHALFCLICERILTEKPAVFAQELGLSLIKLSVLRCNKRPLFARYLTQCARNALPHVNATGKQVFNEVDALGDNLIGACARAGDAYGDVLAELVRTPSEQIPLFDVNHANAEGHSALHVACAEHRSTSPRLYIVHILLHHADADLWKGDLKGGDTAVHLAVNSPHCDLRLVMILFRHIDRKLWKQLAHSQNRSSVTPLEYARSATKSTTRQNYPQEVLEFLKKCR